MKKLLSAAAIGAAALFLAPDDASAAKLCYFQTGSMIQNGGGYFLATICDDNGAIIYYCGEVSDNSIFTNYVQDLANYRAARENHNHVNVWVTNGYWYSDVYWCSHLQVWD
jgi:hypothetical protein